MAYPSYDTFRTPSMTHHSFSGGYGGYGDGSRGMYEDYARYPYGEPLKGSYDEPYVGDSYGENYGYPMYGAGQSVGPYYGGGAYDELALDRPIHSEYGMDYSNSYGGGGMTPMPRRRRSSSMSYHRQLSMGPHNESFNESYGRHSHNIKFRAKGAFRSGVSLSEAVSGVRLSGSDYLKRHEINADGRGRIYLRVRWSGYTSLTYEIPIDNWDGRVRLSSLARRVARACVHFIQANRIPVSWDRVKLYHLEEIQPGTWQPVLTVV